MRDRQQEVGRPTTETALRVLAVTSFRPEEIRLTAEQMPVPVEVIRVEPTAGRLGHVAELYSRTSRAIREHDPDVLLLDCYETMGIVVTLLARRHDVPLVARLVGDIWRGNEQPAVGDISSKGDLQRFLLHRASLALDAFIFERVDGFVTVSTDLRETVRRRTGRPPAEVRVVPVPMTVDTLEQGSAGSARHRHGVDEPRVALTVTNLKFPEKFAGVESVLSEIEPVLREDPGLAYVVAGGGRFHDRLRALVSREYAHLEDRIYVPGHVEEVADLYALADVFVYVSYRDGYPNAVLEAQTAALPVVANADYGMVDQITDGETGYLVTPGGGELRDRLRQLLADPALRSRLGDNARRRVLDENAPEVIARQLTGSLRDIVGK